MKERIATLSNGFRVAQFSSPEELLFEDGICVVGVSETESRLLEAYIDEFENTFGDILTTFDMGQAGVDAVSGWMDLYYDGEVDYVFVNDITMRFLELYFEDYENGIFDTPFRVPKFNEFGVAYIGKRYA